jgi:hypothetical protein
VEAEVASGVALDGLEVASGVVGSEVVLSVVGVV